LLLLQRNIDPGKVVENAVADNEVAAVGVVEIRNLGD
jgi:hypothetical protein